MTRDAVPQPEFSCPLCGASNACAAAASGRFDVACWCTNVVAAPQALAQLAAEQRGRACLCRRCLAGGAPGADR